MSTISGSGEPESGANVNANANGEDHDADAGVDDVARTVTIIAGVLATEGLALYVLKTVLEADLPLAGEIAVLGVVSICFIAVSDGDVPVGFLPSVGVRDKR